MPVLTRLLPVKALAMASLPASKKNQVLGAGMTLEVPLLAAATPIIQAFVVAVVGMPVGSAKRLMRSLKLPLKFAMSPSKRNWKATRWGWVGSTSPLETKVRRTTAVPLAVLPVLATAR